MADTRAPDERLDEGYQMYQILNVPDTRCTRYQMYQIPDVKDQMANIRSQIGIKKTSCLREKASLK